MFGDSTVPEVTGLDVAQATATLRENGLLVRQDVQRVRAHDPRLANRVAFQNPRSCTQVPRGRSVLLKLYSYREAEPGHVYLPQVRLWPVDVAVRFFRELGIADVRVFGHEVARPGQEALVDHVAVQEHRDNAMVRPGNVRVVLTPYVRALPPAGQVFVPNIVDHRRDHAVDMLELKGLAVRFAGIRETPNPTRDSCVAAQIPDAGAPGDERDGRVLMTRFDFRR